MPPRPGSAGRGRRPPRGRSGASLPASGGHAVAPRRTRALSRRGIQATSRAATRPAPVEARRVAGSVVEGTARSTWVRTLDAQRGASRVATYGGVVAAVADRVTLTAVRGATRAPASGACLTPNPSRGPVLPPTRGPAPPGSRDAPAR